MEQTRGKWAEPLINSHVTAITPSGYTDEAREISSDWSTLMKPERSALDSSRGHLLGKTRFYLTCWDVFCGPGGTVPSVDLQRLYSTPRLHHPGDHRTLGDIHMSPSMTGMGQSRASAFCSRGWQLEMAVSPHSFCCSILSAS